MIHAATKHIHFVNFIFYAFKNLTAAKVEGNTSRKNKIDGFE